MKRVERNAITRSKRAQRKIELALLKNDRFRTTLMNKRTSFTYAGEIRPDRGLRGMCKKLVKLGYISHRRVATKHLSAGDESILDRALYLTEIFLATKQEAFRRTEALRENIFLHLTGLNAGSIAGERVFPTKFHLRDVLPAHTQELTAIRQLVENAAIRWPVVHRSSPLYPRDVVEELRLKMLKKEENRRRRLAEKEARASLRKEATTTSAVPMMSSSAVPMMAATTGAATTGATTGATTTSYKTVIHDVPQPQVQTTTSFTTVSPAPQVIDLLGKGKTIIT